METTFARLNQMGDYALEALKAGKIDAATANAYGTLLNAQARLLRTELAVDMAAQQLDESRDKWRARTGLFATSN